MRRLWRIGSNPDFNGPSENMDVVAETDVEPSKKKSKTRQCKSDVWIHFERITVYGEPKARCIHCKKSLTNRPEDGTSPLSHHVKTQHYAKYFGVVDDKGQAMITLSSNKKVGTTELKTYKFDQEQSRLDLARMIILHEYPFSIVDHVGFRDFVRNLQPQFKVLSRTSIKKDCMQIFEMEKSKLYAALEGHKARISVTSDMWTSIQNKEYMALTAHYIDDEWRLQKRIINFSYVPAPHTANMLSTTLMDKFYNWNIDRKLMCLVLDNCSTNDLLVKEVTAKLNSRGCLLARGSIFHIRRCAHILNLIVQDGVAAIKLVTAKVRDAVKYIKSSTLRLQTFNQAISQVKAPNKSLVLDVSTRWNSTFTMLKTALEFKHAFVRFADLDRHFKYLPSSEEWSDAKLVCDVLENFYEVTKLFSQTLYPSANYYFMHICAIRSCLRDLEISGSSFLAEMGREMMIKFGKYWDEACIILAIASILDPRLKMKSVELNMREVYGIHSQYHIDKIYEQLVDLYNGYRCSSGEVMGFDYGESITLASGTSATSASKGSDDSFGMKESTVLGSYLSKISQGLI